MELRSSTALRKSSKYRTRKGCRISLGSSSPLPPFHQIMKYLRKVTTQRSLQTNMQGTKWAISSNRASWITNSLPDFQKSWLSRESRWRMRPVWHSNLSHSHRIRLQTVLSPNWLAESTSTHSSKKAMSPMRVDSDRRWPLLAFVISLKEVTDQSKELHLLDLTWVPDSRVSNWTLKLQLVFVITKQKTSDLHSIHWLYWNLITLKTLNLTFNHF